jgi:hypothetical protein
MKLQIPCMQCSGGTLPASHASVDIREDGRYDVACPNGHHFVTRLKNERYEVLFEGALLAINDGYQREAVSSFAAALERAYEFAIRVIFLRAEPTGERYDKAWRCLKRSELRLGAFIAVWTQALGEVPPLLNDRQVNFRNRVIHQGYFPSRDEAIAFGEEVLRLLRAYLSLLEADAPSGLKALRNLRGAEIVAAVNSGEQVFHMGTVTGLWVKWSGQEQSVAEHVERLRTTVGGVPTTTGHRVIVPAGDN